MLAQVFVFQQWHEFGQDVREPPKLEEFANVGIGAGRFDYPQQFRADALRRGFGQGDAAGKVEDRLVDAEVELQRDADGAEQPERVELERVWAHRPEPAVGDVFSAADDVHQFADATVQDFHGERVGREVPAHDIRVDGAAAETVEVEGDSVSGVRLSVDDARLVVRLGEHDQGAADLAGKGGRELKAGPGHREVEVGGLATKQDVPDCAAHEEQATVAFDFEQALVRAAEAKQQRLNVVHKLVRIAATSAGVNRTEVALALPPGRQ